MPPLTAQHCANHQSRRAHAVCMACRKPLCQECATTWDGVNHCRACLALKGGPSQVAPGLLAWAGWAAGSAVLFVAAARCLAWSAALAARLF